MYLISSSETSRHNYIHTRTLRSICIYGIYAKAMPTMAAISLIDASVRCLLSPWPSHIHYYHCSPTCPRMLSNGENNILGFDRKGYRGRKRERKERERKSSRNALEIINARCDGVCRSKPTFFARENILQELCVEYQLRGVWSVDGIKNVSVSRQNVIYRFVAADALLCLVCAPKIECHSMRSRTIPEYSNTRKWCPRTDWQFHLRRNPISVWLHSHASVGMEILILKNIRAIWWPSNGERLFAYSDNRHHFECILDTHQAAYDASLTLRPIQVQYRSHVVCLYVAYARHYIHCIRNYFIIHLTDNWYCVRKFA